MNQKTTTWENSSSEIPSYSTEESIEFGREILKYIDARILELEEKFKNLEEENSKIAYAINEIKEIFRNSEGSGIPPILWKKNI